MGGKGTHDFAQVDKLPHSPWPLPSRVRDPNACITNSELGPLLDLGSLSCHLIGGLPFVAATLIDLSVISLQSCLTVTAGGVSEA